MIVLGIDAAWTETEPSGVALVRKCGSGWTCQGLSPSYDQFIGLASGAAVNWDVRPPAGRLNATALVRAAEKLAGRQPDIVAVDMPLAKGSIERRRIADTVIARTFGGAWAGVHSPTAVRPGKLADHMRDEFVALGYTLATVERARLPVVLETYPHPIVMQLCGSRRRVPYKAGKTRTYWPDATMDQRRDQLRRVWLHMHQNLAARIVFTQPYMSRVFGASLARLKPYEDAFDALVCTLTGIGYAEDAATPFGDAFAAIWLPRGCEDYAGRSLPFTAEVEPA